MAFFNFSSQHFSHALSKVCMQAFRMFRQSTDLKKSPSFFSGAHKKNVSCFAHPSSPSTVTFAVFKAQIIFSQKMRWKWSLKFSQFSHEWLQRLEEKQQHKFDKFTWQCVSLCFLALLACSLRVSCFDRSSMVPLWNLYSHCDFAFSAWRHHSVTVFYCSALLWCHCWRGVTQDAWHSLKREWRNFGWTRVI